MFANFLIGLREGLEAALVVGILLAYLVSLSLAVGATLTFGTAGLEEETEETFGGVMSLVAVGFVTWMVFWMKRTARDISGNLQGRLDTAIGFGARAIAAVAFIAVAREGLETSLFIWAAVQSTGSGAAPVTGAALGLATAYGLKGTVQSTRNAVSPPKPLTIEGDIAAANLWLKREGRSLYRL